MGCIEDSGVTVTKGSIGSDMLVLFLNPALPAVAVAPSLARFLDSYLRFRSRWFDALFLASEQMPPVPASTSRADEPTAVINDGELSRLVFLTLMRL